MEGKKEQPPESLTVPMLQWEETMSPLAGKWDDCGLVLLHLQQMLEEYPWQEPRLRLIIEWQEGIRDGIEETLKRAFSFWNGDFWERMQNMGFEDPEP